MRSVELYWRVFSKEGIFMDDIILNKVSTIERCLDRIKVEYADDDINLYQNYTKQDAIILNLQRICEAVIDIAMHIVRVKKLGIPQESREAFDFLQQAKIIDEKLAVALKRMVGFRNIAVHDYQKINLEIIKKIVEEHLSEFVFFSRQMLKL